MSGTFHAEKLLFQIRVHTQLAEVPRDTANHKRLCLLKMNFDLVQIWKIVDSEKLQETVFTFV